MIDDSQVLLADIMTFSTRINIMKQLGIWKTIWITDYQLAILAFTTRNDPPRLIINLNEDIRKQGFVLPGN